MKWYWLTVIVAVAAMAIAAGSLAAEKGGPGEGPGLGRMMGRGAMAPAGGMGRFWQGLDIQLTEQQRKRIAEVNAEARKKVMNILTDEQKAKLAEARMGRKPTRRKSRAELEAQLGLTDEQKKQSEAIRKAAKEKAQAAETPQERRRIHRQMRKDLDALLTEEQKAKLKELRRRPMAQLGLSEEQQAAVSKILKRRQQVMVETRKQLKEILTDEQFEKFEKLQAKRGRGPFGRGPDKLKPWGHGRRRRRGPGGRGGRYWD